MSCKIWEHRLKQESPTIGPLTLIYSDGPMFVDPYGPRRRPAMMQQEPYPTNAAVLGRVQQLAGHASVCNPFVIKADQTPLWNAVELSRVMEGKDEGAPTLANMLRKAAKAVRDNSAILVRSGPRMLSPAETKSRQQAIVSQADLLDKFANSSLSAMVRDQLAIEQVFEKLRELGTRAPDGLVSGIAHALTVFKRYPLTEEEDEITEDQGDYVLHYKGYEGRFPKIPMFPHKWTINLSSNDRRLFTKLGGRNIPIDGHSADKETLDAIALR